MVSTKRPGRERVPRREWFDQSGEVIKQKRKTWCEGPTYFANELKPRFVKDAAAYVKKMKRCPAPVP
ncbi:MAG: hypothetical protein DI536_19325 [Archangium gephyra]|uniref:Uncharacterized protein n=1 Tax=Archangium gephyra TaxID=48 RepID=A0A2W5TEH5_9BACT|nr:MAG: hypothetical protein DI536_19325 [Archangium gephyra]